VRLVQRSIFGWGPSDADSAHPTQGLVIHYDGSKQGLASKPHTACIAYWKQTRAFHTGPARGWADLGYSFGACPHGEIFEGRGLNRAQAAQGTTAGNRNWYSVTLMSGPGEEPTAAQIEAVRELRAWLMAKGLGGQIRGHRDFFGTSCPGDALYRLVKDGTFSKAPSGKTPATPSGEDDDVSAKDVWTHEVKVPYGDKDNPAWHAGNLLVNHGVWLRKIDGKLNQQAAQLAAANAAIGQLAAALAARDATVDVDALLARIRSEIESVTVTLQVSDE
jgi:hypothetical protein